MKLNTILSIGLVIISANHLAICQDTFSIVAVDSATGEVGSAGASCVDLTNFPGFSDDFLGELFPGIGAINSQAYYLQANQINARNRMNLGETPSQIIQWLVANDVNNQPQIRQYGIASLINNSPETAAHTGTSTDDYKGHITGNNYSIQGNILIGPEILDSMESRFLNSDGGLRCKLMAALQGANVVGADSRCAANGTSSLFAFLKVALPNDTFGNPSFVISVRTANGDLIEPIDSLQILFDSAAISCSPALNVDTPTIANAVRIYPNPFESEIIIDLAREEAFNLEISDLAGSRWYYETAFKGEKINISHLNKGVYLVHLWNDNFHLVRKIFKN